MVSGSTIVSKGINKFINKFIDFNNTAATFEPPIRHCEIKNRTHRPKGEPNGFNRLVMLA